MMKMASISFSAKLQSLLKILLLLRFGIIRAAGNLLLGGGIRLECG
jgi:hypothetical protein